MAESFQDTTQYRYQTRSRTRAQNEASTRKEPGGTAQKQPVTKKKSPRTRKATHKKAPPKKAPPIPPVPSRAARKQANDAQLVLPQKSKPNAPPAPQGQPQPGRVHESSSELSSDQGSVAAEFGEDIYITDEHWVSALYNTLVEPCAVEKFLRKRTSGYRKPRGKGQWTQIPQDPADRIELIPSVMSIISRIVDEFSHGSAGDDVTREVVCTDFSGGDPERTNPGPSFEIPPTAPAGDSEHVGYTNAASIILVKPEAEIATESDYKQATALVSDLRQIFAQQPNRNFVRSLIVTEKSVRLAHYDRGGMYLTPFINFHDNPSILIHFVLGLTSRDEALLGLDAAIQWTIDPDTGRKVAGTLRAPNVRGEMVVYSLDIEKSPFVRPSIVGRGTTCWHATDPETGKGVVIKDTWRTTDRTPESEFLVDARGIPGVVQMISHQDDCASTAAFRPIDFKAGAGYQNRIKARVVLEECAEPIWNFTSRYQVISALRDAISAHRKLVERGIIHRDISTQNVLFGHPDAPEGLRGILIDFDMAMRAESGMSLDDIDPQTGTRTYQSISVLLADDPLNDPIPPHDYLDDLESFLYVLCHILLGFKRPGELVEPTPRLISVWDDPDASTAMTNKVVLMAEGYPVYKFPHLKEYWGNSCRKLLEGMRAHISNIVYQKSKVRAAEVSTDERFEDFGCAPECHGHVTVTV
ncbi:hypothetical protein D9611_006029 [Ephemerocybe angulata]|uniref:Protein kinase domain-containing protein n=1 Tax=Ephemerocybe angulata TaxID=980116 RepID=A0A8H5FL21_9AGAR|nr:hypothetical protein D9611_006029 [Tulosesus angulatus]